MNEEKISQELREELIVRARLMRSEPTPAEALLWKRLRKRQLNGLKFRRQHIIHAYIVDFYCPATRLVIEIDGAVHDGQKEYDQEREDSLEMAGYQVIRFWNAEVEKNLESVLERIYDFCNSGIGTIDD